MDMMERRRSFSFEDLSVGMSAVFTKTITEADIQMFAEVSGDFNPVHMDETFAQATPFKGRIAHGMLGASFISTVFGTKLPGPGCIYVSQNLRFKAPVRIGDAVVAKVELTELFPDKKRAAFRTTCSVDGRVVLDGDATIMVPSRAVA